MKQIVFTSLFTLAMLVAPVVGFAGQPSPVGKAKAKKKLPGQELKGFGGLRVPPGGKVAAPPHGGKSMVIVSYGMAKEALAKNAKALVVADGWKIESEKKSPRGSVRMVVSRKGTTVDFRVAGRGQRASLIVTRK